MGGVVVEIHGAHRHTDQAFCPTRIHAEQAPGGIAHDRTDRLSTPDDLAAGVQIPTEQHGVGCGRSCHVRQHIRREDDHAWHTVRDPRREKASERIGVERLVPDTPEVLEGEPAATNERPATGRGVIVDRQSRNRRVRFLDGDDPPVVAADIDLVAGHDGRRPHGIPKRQAPPHHTARRIERKQLAAPRVGVRDADNEQISRQHWRRQHVGADRCAPQLSTACDLHGMNEVAIRAPDVRPAVPYRWRADDP